MFREGEAVIELACVVVAEAPGAAGRVKVLLESYGAVVEAEHSAGWLVRIDPQATKVVASHPDVVIAGGIQVPALRRIRKVVGRTA